MAGSIAEARSAGGRIEAPVSAVSWPAIFAGMFSSLAVFLVLVTLGSGFGLAWLSPFSEGGPTSGTFTVVTAIWLIVVQWLAGAIGGYLTGRLRTKWVGTHTREVFFRDTANGFLAWSMAALAGLLLLAMASSALVGAGARAVASVGAAAAEGAGSAAQAVAGPSGTGSYAVDTLFRTQPDRPAVKGAGAGDAKAEAGRILAQGIVTGDFPADDRTYMAQLVASSTGVAPEIAQTRVDDAISGLKAAREKAAEIAEAARKAAAKFAIFFAVSMLIGAFVSSAAAALGGQQRDQYP